MKWDDTSAQRVASAVMEFAARYGLTYEQARQQFLERLGAS